MSGNTEGSKLKCSLSPDAVMSLKLAICARRQRQTVWASARVTLRPFVRVYT